LQLNASLLKASVFSSAGLDGTLARSSTPLLLASELLMVLHSRQQDLFDIISI